jgi:hypothetical protein
MTDEFETQLTAYLIAQFAAATQMHPDDLRVVYNADDETTTIVDVLNQRYVCTAGSDDDNFVFVPVDLPGLHNIEIPFPPFFND